LTDWPPYSMTATQRASETRGGWSLSSARARDELIGFDPAVTAHPAPGSIFGLSPALIRTW